MGDPQVEGTCHGRYGYVICVNRIDGIDKVSYSLHVA